MMRYLAFALLIVCPPIVQAVSPNEAFRIRQDLRRFITGRKAAHMIRAVFHDCIGGCDGCINRNHKFNSGLPDTSNWMTTVDLVDSLYDISFHAMGLSRADFYVMAAEAGIQNAIALANENCALTHSCMKQPKFETRVGRVDCSVSGRTSSIQPLPTATLNQDQVFEFYQTQFGLDEREAVALQGAGHTLGGATGVSGWRGFWKGVGFEGEVEGTKFNNGYFKFLHNPDLKYYQERVDPLPGFDRGESWQWYTTLNETRVSFALNSDIALVKDIKINLVGKCNCTFDECGTGRGAKVVEEFALDVNSFMNTFEIAWQKMTSTGSKNLIIIPEVSDCFDLTFLCNTYGSVLNPCKSPALALACKKTCGMC